MIVSEPSRASCFLCRVGNVKSPLEFSEEEWDQIFKTNLKGSWLVSKYVCIRMRDANRGGSVVNISSIAGLNRGVLPGASAYSTSKAGLNVLTKVVSFDIQFSIAYLFSKFIVILKLFINNFTHFRFFTCGNS